MVFNVSEFNAKVNGVGGLAKDNLFMCVLTVPQTMSYLNELLPTQTIPFLCSAVNLPPVEVETMEFRPYGYGKPVSRPTTMSRHTLNTIFMVDSKFAVKKYFHRWMQSIVNYNAGGSNRGLTEDPQGKINYEFAYKDEYSANLTVYVYGANGGTRDPNNVYRYSFNGVYPSSVGELDLAWQKTAEVMTLPIRFEYDSVYVDALEVGAINVDRSRDNGILTYLSSIQGYVNLVQSVELPTNIQDIINELNTLNLIL